MRSFLAECLLASALKAQPYFFTTDHSKDCSCVCSYKSVVSKLLQSDSVIGEGWVWQKTGVAFNDIQFEVGFFGDLKCYFSEPYE